MKNKKYIKIEEKYNLQINKVNILSSKKILYLPVISAIVLNKEKEIDFGTTDRFLFDTGASITILGSKYCDFLKDTKPIDSLEIIYGTGKKKLPVYEIAIKIQSYTFDIKAALDESLAFTMSLLGYFSFMDQFNNIVLNPQDKKITILKKQFWEV
jgi:hypothetical protein